MPRFSGAFGRRKSVADGLENVDLSAPPSQPSFRVLERNTHAPNRSFDGGAKMAQPRPSNNGLLKPNPQQQDPEDNMFADFKNSRLVCPSSFCLSSFFFSTLECWIAYIAAGAADNFFSDANYTSSGAAVSPTQPRPHRPTTLLDTAMLRLLPPQPTCTPTPPLPQMPARTRFLHPRTSRVLVVDPPPSPLVRPYLRVPAPGHLEARKSSLFRLPRTSLPSPTFLPSSRYRRVPPACPRSVS